MQRDQDKANRSSDASANNSSDRTQEKYGSQFQAQKEPNSSVGLSLAEENSENNDETGSALRDSVTGLPMQDQIPVQRINSAATMAPQTGPKIGIQA